MPTPGSRELHFPGDVHQQLPAELFFFNPLQLWVNKANLGEANQGERLAKYRQGFGFLHDNDIPGPR